MPKAAQVLAALKRDGWVQVRRKGSHRRLVKNGVEATFAFHDSKDMGRTDMAHVAKQFGYTLEELRRLLEEGATMDLRVEYYQDEDTGQWGFVVPRLKIVGGGASTRAEAEEQACEAILFTLEGGDEEPVPAGHDVGYFHIRVEKAS